MSRMHRYQVLTCWSKALRLEQQQTPMANLRSMCRMTIVCWSLVLSAIQAQEVTVGTQTNIDVKMALDIQSLQEVVVVGYGEQKKTTITGAVTSVKGDVIQQAPVSNLSNALTGRLPGTIFINRSGEPGNDASQIRVRGTNTLGNPNALDCY